MARVFVTSDDGPIMGVSVELIQNDDGTWDAACGQSACEFTVIDWPLADAIDDVGTHLDQRH